MSIILVNSKLSKNGKHYNFSLTYEGKTYKFRRTSNMSYDAKHILEMLKSKTKLKSNWWALKVGEDNDASILPVPEVSEPKKPLYYWETV